MQLTVLQYPSALLRKKALPVTVFDDKLKEIVDAMFRTMYVEDGAGLAAIQVNIQQQIIVMDLSEDKSAPLCIINPEIIHKEGIQYEFEGCLSFPEVFEKVNRAAKVRLKAFDQTGKSYEIDAEGMQAICIQHEMDHLNGILFIDHLSRLKHDRARKKLKKIRSKEY